MERKALHQLTREELKELAKAIVRSTEDTPIVSKNGDVGGPAYYIIKDYLRLLR